MEKILNYIKNGRGLGLLFLLAASLVATIMMMLAIKDGYAELKPEVSLVAEDFLPLTVKNGKIVDPVNIYKRVELDLSAAGGRKNVLPIVLDTREEKSVVPTEKQGIFIMRDMLYVVSTNKIEKIALPDGTLDKDNFQEMADWVFGWLSAAVAIFMVFILFVVYLFKAWLATLAARLALKISGKSEQYSSAMLMRLASVLTGLFELGAKILLMAGVTVSGWSVLLLVILAECLYLFKDKPVEA